jgi:alpha-acetolactate decarboxylase
LNVAGFHLHFLRADRAAGGHALDYSLRSGKIQVETRHDIHIELPTSSEFASADLNAVGIDRQIKSAEG